MPQKYTIVIKGQEGEPFSGSLQTTNVITGMTRLHKRFATKIGDKVEVSFSDGTLILAPPNQAAAVQPSTAGKDTVFQRQKLKAIAIPQFNPANAAGWSPETETDVFLVFGRLAELTDYRYCCGASQALLNRIGYKAKKREEKDGAKPDAFLIDDNTLEYKIAEFKILSSDFTGNHDKEDVDVLICWVDDEVDRSKLPPTVISLKNIQLDAIKSGDIPLDELS